MAPDVWICTYDSFYELGVVSLHLGSTVRLKGQSEYASGWPFAGRVLGRAGLRVTACLWARELVWKSEDASATGFGFCCRDSFDSF